ncbi:acetyl-CoA carboxylase carboxyltransferase subunit alpha [Candidatus Aerophobetes bacterium]|nr:acetyl-CoA carboxylase carboxyltransferase subunit alpha [Candidatus Aerophobetes bacterium]
MEEKNSKYILGFEKPLVELENKIQELKNLSEKEGIDLKEDIQRLKDRLRRLEENTFKNLTPWQRVQLARHPARPKTLTIVELIFDEWIELHGDRLCSDDQAIVAGLGKINEHRLVWIGHQKGESIKENLSRNFGMAHPEGYRKAKRIMSLAEKFHLPVVSFIDTPGAYPGIEAEERGQAEAIASNLEKMSQLKSPILVIIIGEGGSGGALGIGVGDRVLMLENAIYSVISPEGCAAILWKDQSKVEEAAAALKLTAQDLLKLNIIDGIIPEPRGGAHRDVEQTASNIKRAILREIETLKAIPLEELLIRRKIKYRTMGKPRGEVDE